MGGVLGEYILVTNFWNENDNIRPIIRSVSKQTHPPREWFFIDDGSPEEAADEAHSEIMRAGDEFGLKVHYAYIFPEKTRGNKLFIGKAWNMAMDWIKELRADYIGVTDIDVLYPDNYWEYLVFQMDLDPTLGCVAGTIGDQIRLQHMPMGGGKLIRWEIFDCIDEFWNLAPDTFWNIKSMVLGYSNRVFDIPVYGRPSSKRDGRELGYRLYYTGNSVLTAFFKAMRSKDFDVLRGFLDSRGAEQCEDPDIRYYYSKRRIMKSLLKRRVWLMI